MTHTITPTEYNTAKKLAHSALAAFQAQSRDDLTLIISQALDARDRASERGRHGSVMAAWGALAHCTLHMVRGNVDRASETRGAFHASLEAAKATSRRAQS